jgi:hypothetical protein
MEGNGNKEREVEKVSEKGGVRMRERRDRET